MGVNKGKMRIGFVSTRFSGTDGVSLEAAKWVEILDIPLGLAITELTAETCIPVIAHHHDFTWERERYAVDAASDYLRAAFPPTLDQVHHIVINSYAQQQLALHAGVSSTVIPNVMDFDLHPPQPDEYCSRFREDLEIRPDQYILLQPTRIIPRKRIEKAIELARRIDLDCVLVVTHGSGDEGHDYKNYLLDYASLLGVDLRLVAGRCAPQRSYTEDKQQIYSLFDIYQQADLVTYPSQLEGFGNALLEAVYYRKPILTSTYRILKTDIQPKGFRFIEFDDYFRPQFLDRVREVLLNPCRVEGMVEHNFETGRRYYSYRVLQEQLSSLLTEVSNGDGCGVASNGNRGQLEYSC